MESQPHSEVSDAGSSIKEKKDENDNLRIGLQSIVDRTTQREVLLSSEESFQSTTPYDTVLKYVGRIALFVLVLIYTQALFYGNLLSNPNWTISNVMVYNYNQNFTNYILFPCYLMICIIYSFKLNVLRIRVGSLIAIIGGIGLILYPVTTRKNEHMICALIIFSSSYFWYPECNRNQLKTFFISSIFFLGGFIILGIVKDVVRTEMREGEMNFLLYLPSICCMLGELGIFITWGVMVQNPLPTNKERGKMD